MGLTEQKPWRGWKMHWTIMWSGVRPHSTLAFLLLCMLSSSREQLDGFVVREFHKKCLPCLNKNEKSVNRLNIEHRCLSLCRLTRGILQFCTVHDMRDCEEPLSYTGTMSLLCHCLWVSGLGGSMLTDVWRWTLVLQLMTLGSRTSIGSAQRRQ